MSMCFGWLHSKMARWHVTLCIDKPICTRIIPFPYIPINKKTSREGKATLLHQLLLHGCVWRCRYDEKVEGVGTEEEHEHAHHHPLHETLNA